MKQGFNKFFNRKKIHNSKDDGINYIIYRLVLSKYLCFNIYRNNLKLIVWMQIKTKYLGLPRNEWQRVLKHSCLLPKEKWKRQLKLSFTRTDFVWQKPPPPLSADSAQPPPVDQTPPGEDSKLKGPAKRGMQSVWEGRPPLASFIGRSQPPLAFPSTPTPARRDILSCPEVHHCFRSFRILRGNTSSPTSSNIHTHTHVLVCHFSAEPHTLSASLHRVSQNGRRETKTRCCLRKILSN